MKKSTFRAGRWLPQDPAVLEAWLHRFRARAEARDEPFHPSVQAFADLIENDPVVRMYVREMIAEVPRANRYRAHHLESVEQMLVLINSVLT